MKHHPYHDYLRRVPMFRNLDRKELDAVTRVVSDLRFRDGDVLVQQGSRAHEMMIVTSGTVAVIKDGEHVAEVGPGGFIGEIAVLTKGHRNSTVTAVGDVEVLHITDQRLNNLLTEVPGIAVKMLPVLAARVD